MLIETMSVREAREQLTKVLNRFRQGDRTPVGVGSHRNTEAVLVPVALFEELTERARAAPATPASGAAGGSKRIQDPGPRTYAGRGLDERRAERHLRFVDAALTVYAHKGFPNTALTDVCAEAGLSRRQFYELFDTTEDLLLAAYDDCQQFFRTAALEALAATPSPDPIQLVRSGIDALFTAAAADRRRMRVAYIEVVGAGDRVQRHRERVFEEWAVFFNGLRTQMLGAPALPAEVALMATSAWLGAVNGLMTRWYRSDLHRPQSELVDIATAMLTSLLSGDWQAD